MMINISLYLQYG